MAQRGSIARRTAGAALIAAIGAATLAGAARGQTTPAEDAAWAREALALQYELSSDVGYRDAPWVGTHNSFNSRAEVGNTLSAQDPNQQIPIVDQLDLGIRSIELDLHWFQRPGTGARAVVVCHARSASEGHIGCTTEPTLAEVLDPIVAWLRQPAHRDQVVNVHLQDELGDAAGYDAAAQILNEKLGSMLYAPSAPGSSCRALPLGLSRDEVRAAGAQVVLVSDCGASAGWQATIFDWGPSHEENRPLSYREYPACDREVSRSTYEAKMIRYWDDSTRLTAGASQVGLADRRDRITVETAGAMARCGVDLIDLDQLTPDDGRFTALVWSWAPGQPHGGRCAVQRVSDALPFGRWRSSRCRGKRPVACRKPGGAWAAIARQVKPGEARATCRRRGARHAVPRTGYEVQLLRERMERKDLNTVWLGYRKRRAAWTALDNR